ncbi:hypothetical protein F383_13975 [Gossypium arboreum]|uniref:Uncharacterized protein n=1 Tax=Gossypium arboreum TaxID=29729 RepID=A0A0B0Q3N5_GOSAR|nr:hypothetical protein F383_26201 [Gossypium arboreum]KHG30671.1 hypothetical protein F383_13975 [Gossypium arboreum]
MECQLPRRGLTCNHISMPLSQTGSYSHTYIKITYRCQCIKCDLTRTHISMPWSYSHITYWNPMS